ncbi:multicopper oxidase domain-containing protein [Kitasatospora sp. NPDC058032]|uniref:multicopper oxidase domain-containing protein n=1 Tax=Kitasatospora sp. NPDC058032 TaxID=3346307 RepID=UPI0036D80A75
MTSRRRFLTLAAGAGAGLAVPLGAATYAAVTGEKTGKVLTSALRLPEAFTVPLALPPVAAPVRTVNGTDYYDLTQREAAVEIVPGTRTTVWGYDGIFPGPTFIGRSGRPMVVQLANTLPVPTSMHVREVSATRYRLRLLNASNARRYRLALEREHGDDLPFVQVGSDAGLLRRRGPSARYPSHPPNASTSSSTSPHAPSAATSPWSTPWPTGGCAR